jgi:hypothetical protein
MRFVVSGVTLFNPRTRSFPLTALLDAYEYLGLTRAQVRDADAAIERLRAKIVPTTTAGASPLDVAVR